MSFRGEGLGGLSGFLRIRRGIVLFWGRFISLINLINLMGITTISVSGDLKNRIAEFGNASESMQQVLERLLRSANERLFHDFIMGQDGIPIEDVIRECEEEYGN